MFFILWLPQERLVWPSKLHGELYIRPELRAGVAFVVLDFKRESLTFRMRHQQWNGTFRRYMPWSTGIAAHLEIENHDAVDFSVCLFNRAIAPWEVIHFPFPGSGERRLRVNWHGRLDEKEYSKPANAAMIGTWLVFMS